MKGEEGEVMKGESERVKRRERRSGERDEEKEIVRGKWRGS